MKRKPKSRSGPQQPESRRRELGAPIVVSVRLPQDLRDAIDAERGTTSRTQWLVEAARERLERAGETQKALAEAEAR
jgi:hypothetical protein